MTTDTEQELTHIEQLDFVPTCDYTNGGKMTCDRPADLVVYYTPVYECGCVSPMPIMFYCEPCWNWRNEYSVCECPDCGALSDPWTDILRVERLKK